MRKLAVVLAGIVGVVACGGSSSQFLGEPDDAGSDGSGDGSADGASTSSSSSSGSTSSGGEAGVKDGSSSGQPDAPGSQQCGPGTFAVPINQSACTTTDACVYELHEVTCCGDREALGLNHAYVSQFQSAEATWESTCPKCGCPVPNEVLAQDGKTGPLGSLQVKCDLSGGVAVGKCVTYFN